MPDTLTRVRLRFASLAAAVALLGGCATGTNPVDPYEGFNRGVYQFNEQLDKAVLKPVAEGYRFVLHPFVRASVSNFFSNLNDVIVVLNNTLQGKFTTAYADLGRILINSSFGVLGLFDVASEAGIEKHDEDFGQTLGWWGVPDGPYIVLPFFGPSNGRDVVGRVGDLFSDPVTYVDPTVARNSLWGTRVVNRRAELLDASKVLETAALDPYEFVRDAYLQRRRNLIYDGKPPPERESPEPPAKPKGASVPEQFPTTAEPTGSGSRLVSGEAQAPVEATHGALPETSPSGPAAAHVSQPSNLAQFWRTLKLNLTTKE
jgi:phospholipid-binding lipoprotein MlaA